MYCHCAKASLTDSIFSTTNVKTSRQRILTTRHIACRPFLLHTPQQRLPMLFIGSDNPQNMFLPVEGSQPPSNVWFRGPMRVSTPNGISIGSAVLQGSWTWQTDRRIQTGHATPYV